MDRSYGAVVYCYQEQIPLYLLVLHASAGHWDFPKGHALPGETPEKTASREIEEEAGCHVRMIPGYRTSSPTGFRKET